MAELFINWTDYYRAVEQLAIAIHRSGWQFNQIVCLAKGGLRVGDTLSRIFDQPLAILAASSYGGPGNQVRGSITFGRDLTMTTANLGSRILLVDDLVDSGITLERAIVWLDRHYGFYISEVKTGVLWYKASSVIAPDYYVDYLVDNPWIHQPFEAYEQMEIDQLANQYPSPKASSKEGLAL